MEEVVALGSGLFALAAAGVFLGTILQRLAGQGFGMVAAPVVAFAAPEFLPAALLLLGAAVGLSSTALDVSAVRRVELPAGFAGRALGAGVAAVLASYMTDPSDIAALVALVVYAGIALSVLGVRVPIRRATLFAAGTVAGVMGTLTAVGAPPMALLYQHEETRRAAAMQNAFFLWGMLVSILALAVAGLVGARHIAFALALAPAAMAGLLVAQPVSRRIAKNRIRPWALGLAGLAATLLLVVRVL